MTIRRSQRGHRRSARPATMKQKNPDSKPDPFAVSLLGNDELRPWTIDPDGEERLKKEMSALENTITLTSPQKNAGKRGVSILDVKFPELASFEETIHQRAKANGYRTKFDAPRGVFRQSPQIKNSQGKTSKASSAGSSKASRSTQRDHESENCGGQAEDSNNTLVRTPSLEEDDPDVQYIAQIQRKMREDSRRMRETPHRPQTVPSPIRYHAAPQPALLSAKMSVSYLKLRSSMQAEHGASTGSLLPAHSSPLGSPSRAAHK